MYKHLSLVPLSSVPLRPETTTMVLHTTIGYGEPISHESSKPTAFRGVPFQVSRRSSSGPPIRSPSARPSLNPINPATAEDFDEVDLSALCAASIKSEEAEPWNTVDNLVSLGLSFQADEDDEIAEIKERFSLESQLENPLTDKLQPSSPERPFNKWIKSLQRKAVQRREETVGDEHDSEPEKQSQGMRSRAPSHHKKSSSASSLGFVTAIKSASISLASFSVAPRSRRTTLQSSHGVRSTDRGSTASHVFGRRSEDSSYMARGSAVDEAVMDRCLQRRRVLEEIISTEESYVADVRFLMNVYTTLLASIPTISMSLRASITRNLTEIVELHEELLGDLHRVVPHSEYTQNDFGNRNPNPGHKRWHSLDVVPDKNQDLTWYQRVPGLAAEPSVAADVAKVFGRKMHRFFAYEEYGAKYELMVKDVASTSRTMPQWEMYQKGLEALARSLASMNSQNDHTKKGLTVGDLLIKPVQRVTRYPLLFSELLRQTPVIDCPESHVEIERVYIRLRETTTAINQATDDPRMKLTIEKTWLLQDRVIFPGQTDSASKNAIRSLGHIHLCGVLHCSWQTKDSVQGEYMICLLFRDCLLLASASKNGQVYMVQAGISLAEARIEEVDNGKGLQCHTAPFSWKLVFESDHQLYEIILSACTPKEELEWRSHIAERACREVSDVHCQPELSLSLPIKSMGTVFGKPGTVARRLSIHRATTIGPRSPLCQIIVKNTSALKDTSNSNASAAVYRSQSLLMTNRVPVLAPARTERIRLETLLSDVWSRDVLPWPGLTHRARSEHLVRASASSMIRKLSVASIASNFSKRSTSQASTPAIDDDAGILASMTFAKSTNRAIQEESGSSQASEDPSKSVSLTEDDTKSLRNDKVSIVAMDGVHSDKLDSDRSRSKSRETSDTGSTPVSSIRRLATLKLKKSWHQSDGNGHRVIVSDYPLRASSANSLRLRAVESESRKTSGTPVTGTENETHSHPGTPDQDRDQSKQSKWTRAAVLQKGLSTGSIKNMFR